MSLAEMIEGPKHKPHVRQVQVGWLGQTGRFYPWPQTPTAEQEPGSYMPVYIDEDDGPQLEQVGWGKDLGNRVWRLVSLRDGPDGEIARPVLAWPGAAAARPVSPLEDSPSGGDPS